MGNLVFEGSKNTEPDSRKGGRQQAIYSYHLGTAPHLMSHIKETKKSVSKARMYSLVFAFATGMGETMDLPVCSQRIQIYLTSS